MDYETLLYETEGEVGILTYNRPRVVNAINKLMLDELNDFWSERQRDFDTRVLIVQGAGDKGFCSGLDMKAAAVEFHEGVPTAESVYNGQNQFSGIIRLMRTCPQPVIAAVHGPAMGAGLSFALASDVRLASEDAMFCAQYINIGTGGADMGSSFFLPKIVGWGRAAEMCMTGDRVPAAGGLPHRPGQPRPLAGGAPAGRQGHGRRDGRKDQAGPAPDQGRLQRRPQRLEPGGRQPHGGPQPGLLHHPAASCRPSYAVVAGQGRVKLKAEPPPGAGSHQIRPPCASTILRAMYRPSPTPGTEW